MNGIPDILSSAQTVLQDGLGRLGKAARELVGGSLAEALAASDAAGGPAGDSASVRPQMNGGVPGEDPVASGLVDTIRAQMEVSAGAALVHVYSRSMDDLFRMLDTSGDRDRR